MAKLKEFKTPRGVFELHGIRGIVTNAGKTSTTHVSGGGSTSVSSRSIIHDQIFIVDKIGKEHVLQLANWDFPAKNDHDISAFWLTKNGTRFTFWRDEYVSVFNHTLDKGLSKTDKELKAVFHHGLGFLIPIVTIILLYFIFQSVSLFSFIFPMQEATSTISFDGTYIDNIVEVRAHNEKMKLYATIFQGVVFIVITIAIIVAYNIITNRKIKNGIKQLKQDIKQAEL